jgi:hypothetical protein
MPFSGLLRGVKWFETDVLGLPISPIFKGQAVQEEQLDCFTFEDGTDRYSRNVGFNLTYVA